MKKLIVCNKCGKAIAKTELPKKDFLKVTKTWGYFSEKDLDIHQFIICEKCYDKMVRSFKIKPKVRHNKKPIL